MPFPLTRTWNESAPAGGDAANTLHTIITNDLVDDRERMVIEHEWNNSVTEDGRHKEGSARLLFDTTALKPADRTTTPIQGAGGNEEGRLFRSSDDGDMQVSDGTNWIQAITAFRGDASNEIDLLDGVQFLIAGAEAMDIHNHGPRHRAGADDQIPRLIHDIQLDTTTSPAITTGDKVTITVDLSTGGRTGSQRVLLIGFGGMTTSTSFVRQGAIFRLRIDTTNVGLTATIANTEGNSVDTDEDQFIVMALVENVTAASHDFHLRVDSMLAQPPIAFANFNLLFVDLGEV